MVLFLHPFNAHRRALMQISKDFDLNSIDLIDLIDWLHAQFTPHSVQYWPFRKALSENHLLFYTIHSYVFRSIKID